ncbi:ABC transporter, ATP-binding protein [Ostertagia ostertagi]
MEPIISIKQLSKNYGEKKVLSDISLDIYPGQIIGYIGPNGAGKSTTVKILTGIIHDYEGEVLVNGKPLRDQVLAVKAMTGYIPELAELYDLLTPAEYLNFIGKLHHLPAAVIEERAQKMLDSFGLSANMHQRMDSFSKGMRQKVLLVAGLIHNPSIVILDEPLSGLDANAVIMVKELLQVSDTDYRYVSYPPKIYEGRGTTGAEAMLDDFILHLEEQKRAWWKIWHRQRPQAPALPRSSKG